jgi:hypothetical protein
VYDTETSARIHELSAAAVDSCAVVTETQGDQAQQDAEEWEEPYTQIRRERVAASSSPVLMRVTNAGSAPLELVGVCCRQHEKRFLAPTLQTEEFPIADAERRRCCVAVLGPDGTRHPCGRDTGTLYTCDAPPTYEANGTNRAPPTAPDYLHSPPRTVEEAQLPCCAFAVCQDHFRASLVQDVRAQAIGAVRGTLRKGPRWIITYVVIALITATYTPFAKTAVMVLSCHPLFQCCFDSCYKNMTQGFALTLLVCSLYVAFCGVLLPLWQLVVLQRRRNFLRGIFTAGELEGRYVEQAVVEEPSDDPKATTIHDGDDETQLQHAAVLPSSATAVDARGAEPTSEAQIPRATAVALWAWLRYLVTDQTSLSAMYQNVKFERMQIPIVLVAFKLIVVLPAVLLEPRSLLQLGMVLLVEAVHGVVVVATAPYLSPWLNMLNRVGVVHQLAIVGLQGFHTAEVEYNRSRDDAIAAIMVAVTSAYMFIALIVVMLVKALPFVRRRREKAAIVKLLESTGFQSAASLPLYVAGVHFPH